MKNVIDQLSTSNLYLASLVPYTFNGVTEINEIMSGNVFYETRLWKVNFLIL